MNEQKHTPGPWTWEGDLKAQYLDFDTLWGQQGRPVLIGVWHNDSTAGVGLENEADAHLIAAAPELLEACRVVFRKCVQNQAEFDSIGKLMASVIAKAEGR